MGISEEFAYQLYKVAQEKYKCAVGNLDKAQYDDAVRIAKRKMKIEEVVLSSCEAGRVVVPEIQVKDALAEIRGRYENGFSLAHDLQILGMEEQHFSRALARELHVNAVLDFVASAYGCVTDTDASLYYYMNIEKFHQPEIRTARHILITIDESSPENQREQSQCRIRAIVNRLTKAPGRFEEQALKHSECPTSLEGGLLGSVKPGVLYQELERVLFTLSVGEISGVVESPLGFHLLRCDEVLEAGTPPLDDVLPRLREYLETQKRKKMQQQWLSHLLQQHVTQDSGEMAHG